MKPTAEPSSLSHNSLLSDCDGKVNYPQDSPWPIFRHDSRNTGRSTIQANYNGNTPWSFQTGKGIFSTPVVDADDTVYIGSADHNFYVIGVDGKEKWRFKTGELIDSAAALGINHETGVRTVTFGSGDEYLYHLNIDEEFESREERFIWSFNAGDFPGKGQCNWFEGNVVIGQDGIIYAGNTNFNYYAIYPDGKLKWMYPAGNNAWSAGSFDQEGNIYWTGLDLKARKINAKTGRSMWKFPRGMTLGPVTSSIALGSDGTVYFASFDNNLYALNPDDGKTKWKFRTTDHIYASPALSCDANGNTTAIYITSADGCLYKVDTTGHLIWRYDTGSVIRSSPVISRAPTKEEGEIIYFGCGNGQVYAINSDTGHRRWSFDTTPHHIQELKDRNDLNGSPALGKTGLFIGGEHGYIWYIPYDYPLHAKGDPRCRTDKHETFPNNIASMFYVTPGGATELEHPEYSIPAATIINTRLVVRQEGETIDAGVFTNTLLGKPAEKVMRITPEIAGGYKVQPSADAHFLHIVPNGFLEPDTQYKMDFHGSFMYNGLHIGNIELGGSKFVKFSDSMTITTAPAIAEKLPLQVTENQVSALEMRRLAVPMPSMMPSFNQIGFDSFHWILGTLEISEPDENSEGTFLIWSIGGRYDENGTLVADRETEFTFPLSGRYKNDFFILENQNLKVKVYEVNINFSTFQLRGQMDENLNVKTGSAAYSEVSLFTDLYYGPLIAASGLVNKKGKVVGSGTYIAEAYDKSGPANKKPPGIKVTSLTYTPPISGLLKGQKGTVIVKLKCDADATYLLNEHLASILLVDAQTLEPVYLDYREAISCEADKDGNLSKVTLTIPSRRKLPGKIKVYVILDVFPIYNKVL